MQRLIDLLHAVPGVDCPDWLADLAIEHITADSRQVKPNTLFVALKGEKADGAQFIAQAIERGAVAALLPPPLGGRVGEGVLSAPEIIEKAPSLTLPPLGGGDIPVLYTANPRLTLAQLAAAFIPLQPAHLAAITGTDGKTSTADFFRQFWHRLGQPSASIGTLGILSGAGETLYPGTHTTPDPVQLHQMLSKLAAQNTQHVAMEASSHGLDQYRLDGVKLEAAAFTNIARDHLDYHQTEEAYFTAKKRLFAELLPEGKTAVLNQDDARFAALQAVCLARHHRIIGFGKNGAEFRMVKLVPHANGQRAELELFGKPITLDVPLVGAFQIMNILAALGLVVATGGELEQALAVVPQLHGVPGRLQQVAQLENGASVFIDYAHTPMALANILQTLRPHTQHRLHVVFGCGGNRDAGKRPEMGRIAAQLADVITITDDNPRLENPAAIRRAILAACPHGLEVADRKEAIYGAMQALEAGDILVIAGKGHETTQIIGEQQLPFDDAQVAWEAAEIGWFL